MSLRIDIEKVEPQAKGVEDPDRQEFMELLDEWCEGIEAGAGRLCSDLEGSIKFHREGSAIVVAASGLAAVDCLMQAMVRRRGAMDTSLAGVYETVLERLEQQREKLHRSRQSV